MPTLWRGDGGVEDRLEIRLVKAREDASGIGWLQVGVQVGVAVRVVHHAVHALAGAGERRDTLDLHGDLFSHRQLVEVYATVVEVDLYVLALHSDLRNLLAEVVHEELGLLGAKGDSGGYREGQVVLCS